MTQKITSQKNKYLAIFTIEKIDICLQKSVFFVHYTSALIAVVFSSARRFRNIPAFEPLHLNLRNHRDVCFPPSKL